MQRQKLFLMLLISTLIGVAFAQPNNLHANGENPWTRAVNLSNSGSASQPLVAIAPDGTQHLLWWDKIDGTNYTRIAPGAFLSDTVAIKPLKLPAILGDKKTEVNQLTGKSVTTITAPDTPLFVADSNGRVHLFYKNALSQLVYAQGPAHTAQIAWGAPQALGDAVISTDANPDANGGLHTAYIRSAITNNPQNRPGLYYRFRQNGAWGAPTLVYSSTYFRVDTPSDVAVNIAGDGKGNVVTTWYQARLGQSWYAVSNNAGKSWTAPQYVSGAAESIAAQTSIAVAPDGTFLLIWRDATARGCGLTQRQSKDGGVTWNDPVPILTGLSNCPPRWSFNAADGKLWFVGAPRGTNTTNAVSLATWDGAQWSAPAELSLTAFDNVTKRAQTLSCLNIALAGNNMAGVGCSGAGDVWSAGNAIQLQQLIGSLKVSWSSPQVISSRNGSIVPNSIATATDGKGVLYAMWSQANAGNGGNSLYFANATSQIWTATRVINPPAGRASDIALAFTPNGKVHAVWNSGQVYYATAFARDANSIEGWSEPIPLPSPSNASGAPALAFDAKTNTLLVAFAVPFNESRGIYLTQSKDEGTTWGEPKRVFDAKAADWESVDFPQLALDATSNTLHLVWMRTTLPNSAAARGIYYAQSANLGASWSSPEEMAVGNVSTPQIIAPGNNMACVAWVREKNGTALAAPYDARYRFSPDNGTRWSEELLVTGFDEVSGKTSLIGDGEGRMYAMALGQTTSSEGTLMYSSWTGQSWAAREVFGLGQSAAFGSESNAVLLPQAGQLTVLLRAPVLSRDGSPQFELVSAERTVTKAEMMPAPVFTPEPQVKVEPTAPAGTAVPTATAPVLLPTAAPAPPVLGSFTQRELVLFGALVGVILLGVIGIAFGFAQSKRR